MLWLKTLLYIFFKLFKKLNSFIYTQNNTIKKMLFDLSSTLKVPSQLLTINAIFTVIICITTPHLTI